MVLVKRCLALWDVHKNDNHDKNVANNNDVDNVASCFCCSICCIHLPVCRLLRRLQLQIKLAMSLQLLLLCFAVVFFFTTLLSLLALSLVVAATAATNNGRS